MKYKNTSHQAGAAMLEVALIIALIAIIAIPAVSRTGIGVKYTVCSYAFAFEQRVMDEEAFEWDTGSCVRDPDLHNPAGKYFFQ